MNGQRQASGKGCGEDDFISLPEPYVAIIRRHKARSDLNMLSAEKTAVKAGIGLSTLWRDLKDGKFVRPVQISERRVAWVESEVDALLDAKRLMSRSSITVDIREFVLALMNSSK